MVVLDDLDIGDLDRIGAGDVVTGEGDVRRALHCEGLLHHGGQAVADAGAGRAGVVLGQQDGRGAGPYE